MPPAVGYSLRILFSFPFTYTISIRYIPRMIVLGLINLINFPFRIYEQLFINPRYSGRPVAEPPVFIIGHWRSGTTHLHNLLSMDPQMGYVTTYQGVFPDTIFNKAGKFLFKNFTRLLIPRTRKGDNVILDTDYPQEEEFALGDKVPVCFYYFWLFPRRIEALYKKAIQFEKISNGQKIRWISNYKLLVNKALRNSNGKIFLSKNPPNTGRITAILEMFPEAKFIFIHRNPVEVFLSTRHFFNTMMPNLQLHSIDQGELDEQILQTYKKLINDYHVQKQNIPEGNLTEIRFEDLEQNPLKIANKIYRELQIPGFSSALPYFEKYIEETSHYKKNKHKISESLLDKVLKEWSFMMNKYNYKIPETIEVTHE